MPAGGSRAGGAVPRQFVVVALVAPFVEELLFRGLGSVCSRQFVGPPAILITGIAFGLAHGLVVAFPSSPSSGHPRLAPLADRERLPGDGHPRPLQRGGARPGGADVGERLDGIRAAIAANDRRSCGGEQAAAAGGRAVGS